MRTSLVERIKTIILTALVISSMLLTYRLWFKDHNLFSILGVFNTQKKVVKNHNGLEYVYLPSKVHLNLGEHSHVVLSTKDGEFVPLQKETVKIIKSALEVQDYQTLDIQEWNKLLSVKSVLLGYKVEMGSELLAKLLNVSNSVITKNIPIIKDALIIQDKTVSNNIKFYIKDEKQGKVFKLEFKYDDSVLESLISSVEGKDLDNYLTGYEFKNAIYKDDVLLLPTDDDLTGKLVKLANEANLDSENDIKQVVHRFFEKFNVVKNIEYKDETKSNIVKKEFIDRKRIVRIFENGQIEYISADTPSDGSVDMYSSLKSAVDFIESNMEFPQNSFISEASVLPDGKGYKFSFDYSIDGLEVRPNGSDGLKHAIEVEVKGGTVTSLKRNVKKYTLEKDKELDVINLRAVDEAIIKYRSKSGKKEAPKSVSEVGLVYVDDGYMKDVYPYWHVVIDGQEFFVKAVSEEK